MRRNRIVVSTSRCGRDNPGSNPSRQRFYVMAEFLQWDVWIKLFLFLKKSIASYKMCADSKKSSLCDQVGYVIK